MMIVISQPRYLPALTYLQRLHFADKFVMLDNVQRQKRGFENRNRVLVDGKKKWLTIPSKSSSRALIQNTSINGINWISDHKQKLEEYYSTAPYFNNSWIDTYYGNLEQKLEEVQFNFTTALVYLVENVCSLLNFEPDIVRASELESDEIENADGPDKIYEIANYLESDLYISGLNGREYGIKESFKESTITVKFHEDKPIPYDQGLDEFVSHLAFFDALFYAGRDWVEEQVKKTPRLEY